MTYVPRRIQIIRRDGKTETISDQEFSSLEAPLVLLGEPGAGKTKTARVISAARDGAYVTAFDLACGEPASLLPDSKPVIDGLDEVQAISSEPPLLAILRRLKELGVRSFAVTCRAADWANVQNERAIESWFTQRLVVGHLQPLNDAEVVAMVDAFGTYSSSGQKFLREAKNRNAVELARNPQSLKLLLAAISEAGWPKTKTDLYRLACENFAKESNQIHQSLSPRRPNIQSLLSAAGFACAQLLLSGKRGLNVDGQDDDLFPRPTELWSASVHTKEIEAAISSLLFRPVGVDRVEPTHRTVAEYLGAQWLVSALRDNHLSVRRLETLLYSRGVVPGPLRGLHAWLAALDRRLTDSFVFP
jgi:hypothetical protein